MNYIRRIAGKFFEEKKTIDGIISKYSGHWKIERLSKPALAILRCAICEILHVEDVTEGVAVNEAVEMAKRYDSEETSAYVNALLRTWLRDREG